MAWTWPQQLRRSCIVNIFYLLELKHYKTVVDQALNLVLVCFVCICCWPQGLKRPDTSRYPPRHLDWALSSHWIPGHSCGGCTSTCHYWGLGWFGVQAVWRYLEFTQHLWNPPALVPQRKSPVCLCVSFCIKMQMHLCSQARPPWVPQSPLQGPWKGAWKENHNCPPKGVVPARAALGNRNSPVPVWEAFLKHSCYLRV